MARAVIFLVRHGETEWNRVHRYQGWGDSPLTARGVAQAEAIGRRLCTLREAEAAEIVASPIGRARRTAEIIRGQIAADGFPRAANLRFDERTFHSARETDSFRERDRRFESLPSAGESVVRTGDIG